jgi:hypothetical protein
MYVATRKGVCVIQSIIDTKIAVHLETGKLLRRC